MSDNKILSDLVITQDPKGQVRLSQKAPIDVGVDETEINLYHNERQKTGRKGTLDNDPKQPHHVSDMVEAMFMELTCMAASGTKCLFMTWLLI